MTRRVARSSVLEGLWTTEWAKLEKVNLPLSCVGSSRLVDAPKSANGVIRAPISKASLSPCPHVWTFNSKKNDKASRRAGAQS
jgi:hypothetical protein